MVRVDLIERPTTPTTRAQKISVYLAKSRNSFRKFRKFIYNRKTNEVFSRDGLSWAKISFFYFFFYMGLGGFFLLCVYLFSLTLSQTSPTYFLNYGCMGFAKDEVNGRRVINPGLGFRPQINPESRLITFSVGQGPVSDAFNNSIALGKNLEIFLNANKQEQQGLDCINMTLTESRAQLKKGAFCKYNSTQAILDTPCSYINNFGYSNNSSGPCVALKLNKIYNWLPKEYDEIPKAINISEIQNVSVLSSNIFIKCEGQYSSDRDAIARTELIYYSPVSNFKTNKIGFIPFFYYPYLNQRGYEQPLVFVHFENLPKNQLINVLCSAYADNIDSDDHFNGRGSTTFQIFMLS